MSVTFRAATSFDLPELVQLYRSAELAETGRAGTTAPDITDLLRAPGLDLVRRSRVAAIEGELRGLVLLHPAPQPGQLRMQLCVSPHPRHRQLAAALLELAGNWVAQDCPGGTDVTVFQLPGSLAAPELSAAGWQIVHSYTRMKASLAGGPRERGLDDADRAGPGAGVTIRAAASAPDLATVHAVLEQSVAGHWNHQERDFASFLADQQARDGHDPSLWLLAEVDGEPAAAVIARAPADRAWIAWLGTLAGYRGRGLAAALLRAAFAELRERGHASVGVDVDTHNKTGALRVYEQAGMQVLGAADQWRNSYPPAAAEMVRARRAS
jgi:mycothiol synthase